MQILASDELPKRTVWRDRLAEIRKLRTIRIMGLPEELFVGYVPFWHVNLQQCVNLRQRRRTDNV
jgi:hypothetical protein